jgi:hypothetical protein
MNIFSAEIHVSQSQLFFFLLWEIKKERGHLGDLAVNGRVILN